MIGGGRGRSWKRGRDRRCAGSVPRGILGAGWLRSFGLPISPPTLSPLILSMASLSRAAVRSIRPQTLSLNRQASTVAPVSLSNVSPVKPVPLPPLASRPDQVSPSPSYCPCPPSIRHSGPSCRLLRSRSASANRRARDFRPCPPAPEPIRAHADRGIVEDALAR